MVTVITAPVEVISEAVAVITGAIYPVVCPKENAGKIKKEKIENVIKNFDIFFIK